MVATNIEWAVDNEKELEYLPETIDIPVGMNDGDEISDFISNKTGFCHNGFDLAEVYIISSDANERKALLKHLSMNGYKTSIKEDELLYIIENEKYEVETILEDRFISSCKRGPIRQLDITKEDVRCCDELIVENGTINVTYELWIEADKYFGWETRYHDGIWINFYTNWQPNGTITAEYSVNGDCLYFHEEWELTKEEQEFFCGKMEEYCKAHRGKSLSELWMEFTIEDIEGLIETHLEENGYISSMEKIKEVYVFLEKNGVDILSADYSEQTVKLLNENYPSPEKDPDFGNCNTCKNYSKCNICSDCHEGSLYEYYK